MTIVHEADLERMAVEPSAYPPADLPELAFVGRSNVGKSSLINYLCARKKLARTSAVPGKTRTINFYRINGLFRFVDLPGYGYAKGSIQEAASWKRMMEVFFASRATLRGAIQLVDSRHEPTSLDQMMYDFLRAYGLSGTVVATKADKISSNARQKSRTIIRKSLNLGEEDQLIFLSATQRQGGEELWLRMDKLLQGRG